MKQLSFEDLQKLKEKMGLKVFNEAMFGAKRYKKVEYKRENKNRPRETSSKKQVPRFREIIPVKKHVPRDPRFDSLCGSLNEKAFKNAYSFVNKLKETDLKALKDQLQEAEDPKEIKKIKYLIQRLENQLREEAKHNEREEKKKEEKQELVEAIKRGEKPVYKKKCKLISIYRKIHHLFTPCRSPVMFGRNIQYQRFLINILYSCAVLGR